MNDLEFKMSGRTFQVFSQADPLGAVFLSLSHLGVLLYKIFDTPVFV